MNWTDSRICLIRAPPQACRPEGAEQAADSYSASYLFLQFPSYKSQHAHYIFLNGIVDLSHRILNHMIFVSHMHMSRISRKLAVMRGSIYPCHSSLRCQWNEYLEYFGKMFFNALSNNNKPVHYILLTRLSSSFFRSFIFCS